MSLYTIFKKIKNFDHYFSDMYIAPEYVKAWQLNKHHGINLNPLSSFSACILKFIVKRKKPQTILEIGTSGGYSALTMAKAAPFAHIHTIEKSAPKAEIARIHVEESGLRNITLYESEALETVQNWNAPIDLLFLDADRKNYLTFLNHLEPHLTPQAYVIADNVTSHPDDVKDFIACMKSSGKYKTFIIPFSKGLLVAKKK